MKKNSTQNNIPILAKAISTPIPTSKKFIEAQKKLPETLAKLKAFKEKNERTDVFDECFQRMPTANVCDDINKNLDIS